MNNIDYIKDRAALILPILLALTPIIMVFFSETFLPPILILMVLISLSNQNFLSNIKNSKIYFYPYVCYVLLHIIYTILSPNFADALKILERQTSFLLIPLIVFSNNWDVKKIKLFFRLYLYILLGVGIFSLIKLVIFINQYAEWIKFMNDSNNNFTYVQFKYPHLMNAHPTYWSYLLVIGNIIILHYKELGLFKNKIIPYLFFIAFNVNVLYLSARTPLVICLLIYLFYFGWIMKSKKKEYKRWLILSVLSFLAITVVFIFQPLTIFKFSNILQDERIFLWPKAIDIIKNNYFVLGEGLGHGNRLLQEYIFSIYDPREHYNGFDLHNQYLKNYIDMGILGISSLIYMLLFPVILALKVPKIISLCIGFISLFALCMLTESTLYVIKGVVIFVIFSSILIKIITCEEL